MQLPADFTGQITFFIRTQEFKGSWNILFLISLRAKPDDGFVADLVEMLASFWALLASPLQKDDVVSAHHHCLFLTFWFKKMVL